MHHEIREEATPITGRQYDIAFKMEAVLNRLHSGKSAGVVAEDLGLSPDRLFALRKLLPPGADLQAQLGAAKRRSDARCE